MSGLTGRAFITLPGFGRIESEKGATLNIGGFTRETIIADTGVAGCTETPAVPSIECSAIHRAGLSLKKLADLKNINVDFETDSGGLWVLQNAWLTEPPSLSDGKIPLKFEGVRAEEIKA